MKNPSQFRDDSCMEEPVIMSPEELDELANEVSEDESPDPRFKQSEEDSRIIALRSMFSDHKIEDLASDPSNSHLIPSEDECCPEMVADLRGRISDIFDPTED